MPEIGLLCLQRSGVQLFCLIEFIVAFDKELKRHWRLHFTGVTFHFKSANFRQIFSACAHTNEVIRTGVQMTCFGTKYLSTPFSVNFVIFLLVTWCKIPLRETSSQRMSDIGESGDCTEMLLEHSRIQIDK